jgi:hypothetical protein
MSATSRRTCRGIPIALAVAVISCATTDSTTAAPQAGGKPIIEGAVSPQTPAEAAAYAEFRKRVDAYLEVHRRAQKKAPGRPTEATPEAIDKHQRALAAFIQQERAAAKRGEIITPEAEKAMKAVLHRVFGGPDGRQLKASIMDENPGPVKISVNGRYPDEVPLSTVPPQVLASLPKLPKEIEYRFVGDDLVLLDVQAHLVIDFIADALPGLP